MKQSYWINLLTTALAQQSLYCHRPSFPKVSTIKYTSRPVRHLDTYQRWFSNNHRWKSKISASLSALGSILQNWGEFFSILQHLLLTAFIFCFQPIRWICRRVFICKYTTLPDTSIILEVGRNCAPMWDNGISSEVILNSDVS